MSETPRKSRGPLTILRESRLARRRILVAVVFSLLYPLSYGPAVSLKYRGVILPSAFRLVYGPIEFARKNAHPPVPAMINWYISMWEPHYS